ncbi:cytochrome P450, partial [Radiomyces spectabilis]|uniref:cytochrome P450 n=1 Tax=Radiomyces spectabilis TaxID=64574 RepID=UPI002220E3D9
MHNGKLHKNSLVLLFIHFIMTSQTISLIVALKGAENLEDEGRIIRFGTGANLDTIRGLVAEKLSIVGALDDILLLDSHDRLLDGIGELSQQQVVYVDVRNHIKEIIPGPAKLPFVGNLYDLLPNITEGWVKQFEKYGPLVEVTLLGRKIIGTNDPAIAEICVKESEYFTKKVSVTPLSEVKAFGRQGLFTTDTDEMDWKLAHKLLMPAFSPRAIKAYQVEMGLIAQQTIKLLETFDPSEPVEIIEWTTNLTFETIGRVGFGYDFHLLDKRDAPVHPFIEAMGYCLQRVVTRVQQAQFMKHLPTEANRRFDRSVELMHETVDRVIQERKASPEAHDINKDLLGFMLNARDENDLGLSDENIRDQVVTFLIAGHDTTANTLAWTLYELSHNPDVEAKVLQEIVDNGITHDTLPTHEQISGLKYMHQVLKETLRKYSPVRALNKYCTKDCIVPGGYKVKADNTVQINVYAMHYRADIYPDPTRFDPDRWTPEEEQKRSRFAWLPFSTGPRACIGMAFALQEAKTVLAMMLHRFKFTYDGPHPMPFDPKMATTKPLNLQMHILPRTDLPEPHASAPVMTKSAESATSPATPAPTMPTMATVPHSGSIELPSVTFLFGTQTGTAQDYASQLASQARNFGFKNVTLCEMDKWEVLKNGKYTGGQGKNDARELVVICTATYNGQPPDSAEHFHKFIKAKTEEEGHGKILNGLLYAVFGLGNKNWRTYQHFPIMVDNSLEELGAERFFVQGEGNADKDMDAEFNEWCAHFWTHTLNYYGVAVSDSHSVVPTATANKTGRSNNVQIHFISPNDKEKWESAKKNRNGECNAKILVNKELQGQGSGRSTRHLEIDIASVTPLGDEHLYEAGDHLEVMPENDPALVEAIALSFGWVLDSVFEVDPSSLDGLSPRSLAASIRGPCTVRNALLYYADISSPPSRNMLACFAAQLRLSAPETADAFEQLTMPDQDNKDGYPLFIQRHRTLLDLQRAYPQVNQLDLAQFLAAVNVMQPRRYSIASSPLKYGQQAHLAVGVVDDVVNDRHYPGLASSFLAGTSTDVAIRASLKSSKNAFGLPSDPSVPIIMIGAGTGFSPFRGFLQERAYQKEHQIEVGETVLLFGCRHPDQDYIYAKELEEYKQAGVLNELYVAFSRQTPPSSIKYVQHQILANAATIWPLLVPSDPSAKPASIYICGSGHMSRDVRRTFLNLAVSFGVAKDEEEANQFLQKLIDEKRYNEDVWG